MATRKIEYIAETKDGKEVSGMARVRGQIKEEELRKAIRVHLSECGIDVHIIEVMGIAPEAEAT